MGYIGKSPEQGRYGKLDQISTGFNGSTATFNLTVDSEAVYPVNPQALIISLNGVIQQPGTDFTVSAATITFTTNPASGLAFFGVILGDALDIGTPSDGSVTVAKMAANSVDSDQYVDGSIDLAHMSANSVDSDQYVDGSIDLAHMSVNSIDSDQYVDGSIDGVHIANDAIDSQHYAAASIDNEHLADNAVDSAELAAGSVDIAHLSASGTASSSTFLAGNNAWAAAGSVTSKTYETTRTASSGTGNQDFTNAGFTPKAAFIIAFETATQAISFALLDSGTNGSVATYSQTQSSYPNIWQDHLYGFQVRDGSDFMDCTPSLLSNGIRFAWTKYGSGLEVMINFMLIG